MDNMTTDKFKIYNPDNLDELPDYFWDWFLSIIKYQMIKYQGSAPIVIKIVGICELEDSDYMYKYFWNLNNDNNHDIYLFGNFKELPLLNKFVFLGSDIILTNDSLLS